MWPWLPERVVVVHIPRVLTYLCSLEYTDNPRTTAVDRRSTPSARADRQAHLCRSVSVPRPATHARRPHGRVFPDHLIT